MNPSRQRRLAVVHLGEAEAVEFVERNPSGERLRGLPQEFGRSAPQHEEAGRRTGTVRENAQELEDVGQAVDFVQDHETLERPQLQPRIVQPREVGGILEVEPGHGLGVRRRQLPGERGLPHLPRAQQGDDGELSQQQADAT